MSDNPFSRYHRQDNIQSVYNYQGTDVYINKLGIRDPDVLSAIENDLTYQRLSELHIEPIKGYFGLNHLQKIHKYIFQDLYSFAGKLRKEDIEKGTTKFCKCQYIEKFIDYLIEELKSENFLSSMASDKFIERSAYYLSEFNMVHPFREGNGRTFREYYRCLALKNGYIVDWSRVDSQELLDAFIYSVTKDTSKLIECIHKTLVS